MMRCDLAILLAERNLKITKISNDTGISRTTLTSLYYNYAKGIQFDTYNTLCNYLKVAPGQLISYIPIDVSFKSFNYDTLELEIKTNNIIHDCALEASTFIEEANDGESSWIVDVEVAIDLKSSDNDEKQQKENKIIIDAFQQLPTAYLSDLEKRIVEEVIINNEVPEDVDVNIYWYSNLDTLFNELNFP